MAEQSGRIEWFLGPISRPQLIARSPPPRARCSHYLCTNQRQEKGRMKTRSTQERRERMATARAIGAGLNFPVVTGGWPQTRDGRALTDGDERRPDVHAHHEAVVVLQEEPGAGGRRHHEQERVHAEGERRGQKCPHRDVSARLLQFAWNKVARSVLPRVTMGTRGVRRGSIEPRPFLPRRLVPFF